MYTDKAYLVRDRFPTESRNKDINTLYGPINVKKSIADTDIYAFAYGKNIIRHCPLGLESLYNLDKVYLIKRLEMFQDDVFNDYKGELIDEQGHRIFLITSAAHHFSDEVVHYGRRKSFKFKGKLNYGALNYAGIQLFEISGDPEKVIRVGTGSGIWGEIQVIPGDVWNRIHFNCCCIEIGRKTPGDTGEAEIRVIVMKKDNRVWPSIDSGSIFKQVYTLRGKVSHGCQLQQQESFLYKKTFDLNIFVHDPFVPKLEEEDEDDSDEEDEEETAKKKTPKIPKTVKIAEPPQPIGRICSQALHQKLKLHLPIIEFPQHLSVYDKLTLMGTFFLFNLKI